LDKSAELPPGPDPIVRLQEVGKVYDGAVPFRALEGVDLEVRRGEFAAIVGQSGSGKSTLLNILGTLDRASEGTVEIAGGQIHEMPDEAVTTLRGLNVGFIFQFHYLLPDFSVLENVLMSVAVRKSAPSREDVREAHALLEEVGIAKEHHRRANEISGGQQQRVAIARALLGRKPLILADEPTGNLDSVTSEEVFSLMRRFNQEWHTTFLIVTHDERIAERTDRIIRITDGRVVADDRR